MTETGFYIVLGIIIFAILINALLSFRAKRKRTAWRKSKLNSKRNLLTQKKQR